MGLGGAKNLPIIRATKYARELEVHLVQANYPKYSVSISSKVI